MLTYLSNESRIIPLTMATRSSAKLLHSKSYAGGPRGRVRGKKDPLKGQPTNFIAIIAKVIKSWCVKLQQFLFLMVASSPLCWTGCPCTLMHVNLSLLQSSHHSNQQPAFAAGRFNGSSENTCKDCEPPCHRPRRHRPIKNNNKTEKKWSGSSFENSSLLPNWTATTLFSKESFDPFL